MVVVTYKKVPKPIILPDKEILKLICSSNVCNETKLDAESLFNIAKNILSCSTTVVDNLLHGKKASVAQFDNINTPASFTSPLCELKDINSKMACQTLGEETAHKTTVGILKNLTKYSWVSKGVLALAAFSIEYGEFWLSQHLPTEPLAKSLGIIKKVPQLTQPKSLKKHKNAISELNDLIKDTLKLVGIILKLNRLNSLYDISEVKTLAKAMEQIPVDVYWVITAIAGIVTQIECLTGDKDERLDLTEFRDKITTIIKNLEKLQSDLTEEIDEAAYRKILNGLFQIPNEITEILKVLIFWKDTPKAPFIYDGLLKKEVEIDVLKKKDVLLFITTLNISQENIFMLKEINKHIKEADQHKILWVPIVEKWDDKAKTRFHLLKSKMPWYVLQHFESLKGIKYIKEEWLFKQKPMVVVLSPHGKILHRNAYHMIRVWGAKGFPFTKDAEKALTPKSKWNFVESVVVDINLSINWEEKKSVIIYGGKATELTEKLNILKSDTTIKDTSLELVSLGNLKEKEVTKFWKKVESLVVIKMHDEETETVKKQVEKLLSYRYVETGWAIVIKGKNVTAVGHQTTISKTVDDISKWSAEVVGKGFDEAFTQHHKKVVAVTKGQNCHELKIHNFGRKKPDIQKCPHCEQIMEVVITYKCSGNKYDTSVEDSLP